MIDLIAFYGARAGTVAPLNVAGLADDHVTVIGNNIVVPDQCTKILAVYAMSQATAGSLTSAVTLSSPSMRAYSNLELSNWNANGAVVAAAQIPDNNAPFNDFRGSPIPLKKGESLQCLSAVDAAAAAENIFVLIWLSDGNLSIPLVGPDPLTPPRVEQIIFDAQAAAVINVWSTTAILPRQALRAGTYAVVGAKVTGTSLIAARFIFGNQGTRPGCLATNSPVGAGGIGSFADSVDQMQGIFRNGKLGIWGLFSHINPPQMQVLASVADAAVAMHVVLDVIRVGD